MICMGIITTGKTNITAIYSYTPTHKRTSSTSVLMDFEKNVPL